MFHTYIVFNLGNQSPKALLCSLEGMVGMGIVGGDPLSVLLEGCGQGGFVGWGSNSHPLALLPPF